MRAGPPSAGADPSAAPARAGAVDGLGAALTRALASTPLLGAVVGLVTWFPYLLTPASGLDGSWRTALQMATAKGLDFGTEASFSYGPLGFLENPQVTFDSLAVAAAIYTIPGRVILGIALLYVTRRRFGFIAGLVLSFALGLVMPNVLLPLALASLLAIASVTQQGEEIPEKLLVIAGPALAAIAVLLKINLGLIVLAIVTVAVLVRPNRVRNSALAIATFVLVASALWFATGQGLGNVLDYAHASFEIVIGYSTAMMASN